MDSDEVGSAAGEGDLPQVDDEGQIEVPISAIEHFSYCPRQCGLIHVEQTYEENLYTVQGSLAHERVDSGDDKPTRGVPVARGIPLWSWRLGLYGKADLVELRPAGPYPVEYKVGRRGGIHSDLQLCAQALCLEEMLGTSVTAGAIYHHATRRREEVSFTADLRQRTEQIVAEIREMLRAGRLPAPVNDARCPNCSLFDACLPNLAGEPNRLRGLQSWLYLPWDPPPDREAQP